MKNHLEHFERLQNRYFALRHGKSKANEEGIIVSAPETGTRRYGLVAEGQREVRIAIAMALEEGTIDGGVIIMASDFLRARQTAEIARSIARIGHPVHMNEKLRERFFGEFEGKSNRHYEDVWKVDKLYPHHKFWGVESANEVQERTTSFIAELEYRYTGKTFILVSHGDALQILDTGFKKISPKHHRDIDHLGTAEIRELTLATSAETGHQKTVTHSTALKS